MFISLKGGVGPDHPTVHNISIKAEVLKRVYDSLLLEAGVSFSLHTQLIDVEKEENMVSSAILAAKSGIFAVKAKIYI